MNLKLNMRSLHPGTWWLLGISLALSATMSRNLWLVLGICVGSILLMTLGRSQNKRQGPAIWFYLVLAAMAIASRFVFKVIFNESDENEPSLISLPAYELNLGFGQPISILGNISATTMNSAVVEGTRLAAIILGIGLAATLANPRKLLRSTPAVLFEIATAVSMAINLVPQLMRSLERIRSSRRLRGRSSKVGLLSGTVIPVLEDAIESSMNLAASMAARGFGHQNNPRVRLASGLLALSGVVLIAIGSFLITASDSRFVWILFMGLAGSIASVVISSLASKRTRHTKQKIRLPDYLIVLASTLLLIFASVGAVI